ncbi:MAG: GDSL-type esterase/lipase family protein [Pirellulaceae bacterium]
MHRSFLQETVSAIGNSRIRFSFFSAVAIVLVVLKYNESSVAQQPKLVLQQNDRIAIIGNTLAERMQHDGFLEHNLQSRFSDLKLSVRNLGFSADTIDTRLRSAGFGTPDQHLSRIKADVIFMMFGFNESFDGDAGLEAFRSKYDAEVKRMLQQKYNGESAPRLVLISPIAHENLEVRDLPTGEENNLRLEKYTQAIAQVAKENNLPFVDLLHSTAAAYQSLDASLTFNGIHLNSTGNRVVANQICNQLFGNADNTLREDLLNAILDKNFYWWEFYRATDGYSIFGQRGELQFVEGQTNREVMTRELEILVQMAENRDKVIWAALENKAIAADDSNLPPFIPVVTNKPGDGPEGQHVFLGGEEAIKKMKLLEGFEINLFASEEMFPEFVNPVQMAFDPQGRLWVAVWPSYPHWKPKDQMNDKLLILEDTDGDGRADVCKTFADKLHNPTGFEFYNGGVIIAQTPDIMFLKDTDGDDVCDVRQRIIHGIDSADTHHTSNSFVMGQDGALYFQEGVFHHTQIETPYGPVRSVNAGSYRFEPRTFRLDVYTPYGYANPHGHVFDRFGRDIIHDGTSSNPYDSAIISGHLDHPAKHPGAPMVYSRRTRPCPATEFVSGGHFPESMVDELLVENVIGDLGILRYKIEDKGSSMFGVEQEPLLLSDDPNFRPVDLEFAPDGSLYLIDWQNPIIGHMQHNLRDPSRDRVHGRAYRITNTSAPLLNEKPASELSIAELIKRICTGHHRERYRARLELSSRTPDEVVQHVQSVINSNEFAEDSQQMELLWILQQFNSTDDALLGKCLQSELPWVRAAATRVLTYCHDRVSNAEILLATMSRDEHPRVRLMAARAASFLDTSLVQMEILANVSGRETDYYLDYVIRESLRTVNNDWKSDVASASWLGELPAPGLRFVLDQLTPAELREVPPSPATSDYLIFRAGLGDAQRRAAIDDLARDRETSSANVLLDALKQFGQRTNDRSVLFDLVRALASESSDNLAAEKAQLQELANQGDLAIVRQIGWIGWMLADRNIDEAWSTASKTARGLNDIASALSLLPDPVLQTDLYGRVAPLVLDLPENIIADSDEKQGMARFVRIELPGKQKILTLAEVKVWVGSENIATVGKATQSSTAHGATADRAIDGDTNPLFTSGTQTHTVESTNDPWWELDLGKNSSVESIEVFNRIEGQLGDRLSGFRISVLDEDRNVLFTKSDIPAPEQSTKIPVGLLNMAASVRQSAIDSISQVRGREADAFAKLAELIKNNDMQDSAIRAIQRIPARFWNPELGQPLAATVVKTLTELPESERASDRAAEFVQVGQTVSTLLPPEESSALKKQLAKLGVEVFRLGTKPHRMAYDKSSFVVEAGKPVVVIFENTDMMPHNFVLANPGSMERLGQQAELESTQKESMSRGFVPQSSDVLASSGLVQPQQIERIQFIAPKKPGVYPYVCTYPGHWRRMFGALYVVESRDDYSADPIAYVEKHELRIQDPLLSLTISQKEWTMADFEEALAEFKTGRDFSAGRQVFTAANCIACHQMQGQGKVFGPDLTKLDDKWDAREILSHLIEPSKKIDDKFRTRVFLLASGQTVSGLPTFEDDDVVKLVENPMVATDEIVVDKQDIDDSNISDVSIMPKGLLDTLTADEVMDLLAYILAKGDESNELFEANQ